MLQSLWAGALRYSRWLSVCATLAIAPWCGAQEIPVLEGGTLFLGEAPLSQQVGSAAGYGADAQVIARWDTVPYQHFDGIFEIGVVAFHINGVDRVEFSLDGGPWTAVTEMTLNPRTGVWAYCIALDAGTLIDNLHEIRAVVFPAIRGQTRVLGGEITDVGETAFRAGEHSMFLVSNGGGSLPIFERYVAPGGSDSTGDGTRGNPFATIYQAAIDMHRDAGSPWYASLATVYLEEGTYPFSGRTNGFPTPDTTLGWLNICGAPGTNRSLVRIQGADIALNTKGVRFTALTNVATPIPSWPQLGTRIWFDNCLLLGPGPATSLAFAQPSVWRSGIHFTSCAVQDLKTAFVNPSLIRDTTISNVGQIAFDAPGLVINCIVDGIRVPSGESFHPDLIKISGHRENLIVYGLDAIEIYAQGIFSRGDDGLLDNDIAFVNVRIDQRSHFSQWLQSINHLLLWNVGVQGRIFRFDHNKDGSGNVIEPLVLRNVSIRECVFEQLAVATEMLEGLNPLAVKNNHFINGDGVGFHWTAGPLSSSLGELDRRSQRPVVPIDLFGQAREVPASIGPINISN